MRQDPCPRTGDRAGFAPLRARHPLLACSPNPLSGCSSPFCCKRPRGHAGLSSQQQDRLRKEREQRGPGGAPKGNPFQPPLPRASRPSPHKESLQPSPRSHVLPELVKDEAGLVRQLAGRHAVGTGATLRRGPASWHGAATSVPPGPGPRGAGLHMSLTTRLSKSRLDASTICGCWGQRTAPGDLEPKPFMLRSSCSQAAEELYSY